MDYRQRMTTREYFERRVRKTLIPFVLWTLIGIAVARYKGAVQEITPRLIATELIAPSVMQPYWFFNAIFGVYLCIPVISAVQPRERLFPYLVCAGLIGQSILPLAFGLLGLPMPGSIVPTVATGYIFYAVLGYELANRELSQKQALLIYALGICGFAMQMFGTWALSDTDKISTVFKNYLNLPAVLQTSAVFVAAKRLFQDRAVHAPSLVKALSRTTFGTYLVHLYFVRALPKLIGITTYSIVWRTIGALCVFLLCSCIVWALQRLKPIKKYLLP